MNFIALRQTLIEGLNAIRQLLAAIGGWIFGYPLTQLIARDAGLMVIISRSGPIFADNSKYFFIYATTQAKPNDRVIFLTSNPMLYHQIQHAGGVSTIHPSWRSRYLLLRASIVITDMADWFKHGAYPLTQGAIRVQIWHGAPLKHVELDLFKKRLTKFPWLIRNFLSLQKWIVGRYPLFDYVVSTSKSFTNAAFQSSFRTRQFINTGYPRNDILSTAPPMQWTTHPLISINVDHSTLRKILAAKTQGQSIALYVPTYRKDGSGPFPEHLDLARLSIFAQQRNALIVLKLHPLMSISGDIEQYPNLLEHSPSADVYPLMPLCDLLITDYSSIFFDFLLLDKPILFFAYDLTDYLRRDSAMYFPYETMTPGPICTNQTELEKHIDQTLHANNDAYANQRQAIRAFTHDHLDNQAARRLYQTITGPYSNAHSGPHQTAIYEP